MTIGIDEDKYSNVKSFMRNKSIEALTGRDHVYNRASKRGLPAGTMFYYTQEGNPTLYYNEDSSQTTYISLGENTFEAIDKGTTTIRDNFNIKNNIINALITANALIEDEFSGVRLSIHSDLILLKTYESEKGIDWRYFDLGSSANPIYKYIHSGIKHPVVERMKLMSLTDLADESMLKAAEAFDDANTFDWFNAVMINTNKKSVEEATGEPGEETGVGKSESAADEEENKDDAETTLEKLDGIIDTDGVKDGDRASEFLSDSVGTVTRSKKLSRQVDELASRLASKLKGVYGKENTITPQKKLNIRNYVRGSRSMFKRKRDTARGKKMKINLIIDCSGSMSGHYIKNAAAICMIFNKIARSEGTISGKVMLSAQEGNVIVDIKDATPDVFDRMHAFSGAEGIARTVNSNIKILGQAYTNICITDCQLTDEPINKKKYESKNIMLEGIYIGKVEKSSIKEHEKHMNQYFTRSKIIKNIDDTVEYLINTVF